MLSECESHLKISSPDRCIMVDELSAYFYIRINLCINYLYLKNIYVKQSAVLANPPVCMVRVMILRSTASSSSVERGAASWPRRRSLGRRRRAPGSGDEYSNWRLSRSAG